jgi:dTDP-4-amino-4,6-dideoxygalactose transaminase
MVTTGATARAEKLQSLRMHGLRVKYYHETVGSNFRLDALQAAVVRVKLRHLEGWTAARQRNAARCDQVFRAASLAGPVGPARLVTAVAGRHVYNQYVIHVPRRNEVQAHLRGLGIGTEVYYPVPLHMQACFAGLRLPPGRLPRERAGGRGDPRAAGLPGPRGRGGGAGGGRHRRGVRIAHRTRLGRGRSDAGTYTLHR